MDVEISTSDPDNVDPARVAAALQAANFFVLTVTVNEDIDGAWTYDPETDVEAVQTEVEADEGGYTEEVDAAEITQSQVTVEFRAQAWVNDNAIEVDAEGETEWRVSVATAEAIPASLERGSDLDWVKGDRYTPLWIREFQGPFEIEVVDDDEGLRSERETRKGRGDIGWEG